jgi:arylsulfatase A-like enzyme
MASQTDADAQIGRLVSALEQHGVAQSTIVALSTDNVRRANLCSCSFASLPRLLLALDVERQFLWISPPPPFSPLCL